MDILRSRRRGLNSRITAIQTQVNKYPEVDQPMPTLGAQFQFQKLCQIQLECDQLHRDFSAIPTISDADFDIFAAEIEALNERIQDLNFALIVFLPPPPTANTTTTSGSHSSTSQVKLPKLNLPTFNGDQLSWSSFRDLFSASVHANKSITRAQKLQYLKSALKSTALELIQSINITDANYEEAWAILNERYDNQKTLVFGHLKTLVNHPSMTSESANGFRKLLDTFIEHTRALEVLRPRADHWDSMLVYLATTKLDPESLRRWSETHSSSKVPTFKELTDFMKSRRVVLEELAPKPKRSVYTQDKNGTKSFHSSTDAPLCVFCNEQHWNPQCPKYKEADQDQKRKMINQHKLCLNCLRSGHSAKDCKGSSCKKCGKNNHHTSLHYEKKETKQVNHTSATTPEPIEETMSGTTSVSTLHSSDEYQGVQVLLSTALVNIEDFRGQKSVFRALLDSASEASFISEDCAQKLGLKRKRINVSISGLVQTGVGHSHSAARIKLSSLTTPFSTSLDVMILPKVTGMAPRCKVYPTSWSHIESLALADPKFHEPSKIDILLGGDIYFELMMSSRVEGIPGTPMALQTKLGWILGGKINTNMSSHSISVHHAHIDLDSTLKRFWELEDIPQTVQFTEEEKKCEEHFATTHKRTSEGRFVVQLPFKENTPDLGFSRDMAIRRFKQLERRLSTQTDHQQDYNKFMSDYESLGHMEEVNLSEIIPGTTSKLQTTTYHIPHHFVLKASSTTTKFRVVFDASAKTTTGVSLNEKLMVGPKLQDDLIPILIRFRTHPIAITGDIAKMYRQIRMNPQHCDFQRIFWRPSPDLPLREYRLTTVTYGTASAPHSATKCLQQLIHEESSTFPIASEVAKRDLYIDDLLTGATTTEHGLQLQSQMIELFKRGSFEIRKFSSNDPILLEALPVELRETQLPLRIDVDEAIKTLGIRWNPATDNFSFSVNSPPQRQEMTKRSLLSDLAKTFDPLGWLSPITIKAKILFQQLWCIPLTWDQQLMDPIVEEWNKYCLELKCIEDLEIPRYITRTTATSHQLHGFCDASEKAYAAVVYIRSVLENGEIVSNMVAAKTKVAPIKQISLPRLELCGALLLSKLTKLLVKSLNMEFEETHAWSDSTVVLAWLADHPNRWKTFVANRVSQIQDVISPSHWHHVRSEENPADCASRGISPSELRNHHLWWQGPPWLMNPDLNFPIIEPNMKSVDMEEKKSPFVAQTTTDINLPQQFSSLSKLIRVSSFVFRFIRHCRIKQLQRPITTNLDISELDNSLNFWVKSAQSTFAEEMKCLEKQRPLPSKSKLLSLNPFIDESGFLRVGGRLQHAHIHEKSKHPILIPKNHTLTELIIRDYHIKHLHGGLQLTLAAIQQKFWIISGRDMVRHFIFRCVTCHRQKLQSSTQMMGQLPSSRVIPTQPFLHCGVDYAGPIVMRILKGRGQKTFKGYISVFVCFTTKAIHLELVSELTTQGFIAALKRFIARRGKCSDISSDNGTNFVGANRELKEFMASIKANNNNNTVSQFLTNEGINWHFIPASAPHFGGLWEAGVKSVKHHLRRVIGDTPLNFEDMTTLLAQIEACLNSRPLTPMSSDPNDLSALTPGHFLIGRPLTAMPEPDYSLTPINRLSKWQFTQRLTQHFWNRWSQEYLTTLQSRNKWTSRKPDLKIDDLVLVKEDNLPPTKWCLGRVLHLHPGKDNCVRVVTVKTISGELKRPIVKLYPLPINV